MFVMVDAHCACPSIVAPELLIKKENTNYQLDLPSPLVFKGLRIKQLTCFALAAARGSQAACNLSSKGYMAA
jgi:hypothetical protein